MTGPIAITEDAARLLEKTLRKIADKWSVVHPRMVFNDQMADHDPKRWRIEGRCVSTGHPVAKWNVGEFHMLGYGPTLPDALRHASLRPTVQAAVDGAKP